MTTHTETKISPIPWSIGAWDKIKTPDGESLLVNGVSLPCGNHPKDAEATANAHYIVRACNSFPALLAALERLLTDDLRVSSEWAPSVTRSTILDAARAAIAAAKAP